MPAPVSRHEHDLEVAASLTDDEIIAAVTLATKNLSTTQVTTLASFPGSTHWHFKQGSEPGVLELTWWPKERRLWFKVARNRQGDWIEQAMQEVKRNLIASLHPS